MIRNHDLFWQHYRGQHPIVCFSLSCLMRSRDRDKEKNVVLTETPLIRS